MIDVIEQHRIELDSLCGKYGVKLLELFGSAARGDFNAATSDLDFLVLYQRESELSAADRYLGLLEDLQQLFNRKVDLVDIRGTRNPYFVAEALKHRVGLYAA